MEDPEPWFVLGSETSAHTCSRMPGADHKPSIDDAHCGKTVPVLPARHSESFIRALVFFPPPAFPNHSSTDTRGIGDQVLP